MTAAEAFRMAVQGVLANRLRSLLTMLGIVGLTQRAVDVDQLAGAQREATALDARKDLAGELPLDRVRLDQDE